MEKKELKLYNKYNADSVERKQITLSIKDIKNAFYAGFATASEGYNLTYGASLESIQSDFEEYLLINNFDQD
jgi:hypothetical protein